MTLAFSLLFTLSSDYDYVFLHVSDTKWCTPEKNKEKWIYLLEMRKQCIITVITYIIFGFTKGSIVCLVISKQLTTFKMLFFLKKKHFASRKLKQKLS